MGKRVFFVFLWLIIPFLQLSAGNERLTDDDAGQLLYSNYSDNGIMKGGVLVLQKVIRKKNGSYQLECTPFRGNGSICYIKPEDCTKLDYTVSELTPETVVMELAYCKCNSDMKKQELGYLKLAERMNMPETNLMLAFYADLEKDIAAIKQDIGQYRAAQAKKALQSKNQRVFRQNSCPYSAQNSSGNNSADTLAKVLEKGLKASLKRMNAVQVIQKLTDRQKNYFLAYCFFYNFRNRLRGIINRSGFGFELRKELLEEIEQVGEDIREKYNQNRLDNQNREKSFQNVFKDKHGAWEYASPANQKMMAVFVNRCYTAWKKTQTLSPHSEFPEWGNAMLEVLQMIRKPDWEKQFDAAFSEYQKYNNN